MIVVSDTSPLTALLAVGHEDILPQIIEKVVTPQTVRNELLRSHVKLPEWLRIFDVKDIAQARKYLQLVDVGEAEATELARELQADRLLMTNGRGANSPFRRACR